MNDIENVKAFCKGYQKYVQEQLSKIDPENHDNYTRYAQGLETAMKNVIEFIEKCSRIRRSRFSYGGYI